MIFEPIEVIFCFAHRQCCHDHNESCLHILSHAQDRRCAIRRLLLEGHGSTGACVQRNVRVRSAREAQIWRCIGRRSLRLLWFPCLRLSSMCKRLGHRAFSMLRRDRRCVKCWVFNETSGKNRTSWLPSAAAARLFERDVLHALHVLSVRRSLDHFHGNIPCFLRECRRLLA